MSPLNRRHTRVFVILKHSSQFYSQSFIVIITNDGKQKTSQTRYLFIISLTKPYLEKNIKSGMSIRCQTNDYAQLAIITTLIRSDWRNKLK